MGEELTSRDLLSRSIVLWMQSLDEIPEWSDWQRQKWRFTLFHDDDLLTTIPLKEGFHFQSEIEQQHAVVMGYLNLSQTLDALKDVEWYFRRYPFASSPITREKHLRYCCETYFNRFYQFKERLKVLGDALSEAIPNHRLDFGSFIKTFGKEFSKEIAERNKIHHHAGFEDVGIDRILLIENFEMNSKSSDSGKETKRYYRSVSKEWVERVRRRASDLESFLEAMAVAILKVCSFLPEYQSLALKN